MCWRVQMDGKTRPGTGYVPGLTLYKETARVSLGAQSINGTNATGSGTTIALL